MDSVGCCVELIFANGGGGYSVRLGNEESLEQLTLFCVQ
jgi:hypothetical protein